MPIQWTPALDLGIPVIDRQHRRIVEYINRLEHAHEHRDREALREVIFALVDYTRSHFAFEEALMAESGYPFLGPHRKAHELFTRRVDAYRERFALGEDVSEELLHVLTAWLVNHIRSDDRDYAAAVRENLSASDGVPRAPDLLTRPSG